MELQIDCSQVVGEIRPLHGGNCGPLQYGELVDLTAYHRELGIPYTRLHDCHWPNPDVVDIHAVFPNPAADPERAESYDFRRTDDYLQAIVNAGSRIVYRLGESIEHSKRKYHVNPPQDYERWAGICCGIIRHYNEGFSAGFRHDIRYWEIWNEPENRPAMWTGSDEDYFRLYETAAKAIKARWPNLKVGGPSLGYTGQLKGGRFEPGEFLLRFLERCKTRALPLDFFSWHLYTDDPSECLVRAQGIRAALDRFGFAETELHFNEWNYLPGNNWAPMTIKGQPEARERFYEQIGGAPGAAFAACVLLNLQDAPVQVANYYMSDNHGFGLFTFHGVPRKNFYAMKAFRLLLDTPLRVQAAGAQPGRISVCAGLNREKSEAGILISNLRLGDQPLRAVVKGLPWQGAARFELAVVDAAHNLQTTRRGVLPAEPLDLSNDLKAPAIGLLKLRPEGGNDGATNAPQAGDNLAESVSRAVPAEAGMLGVNLAGGDFGPSPGVFNKDYTYPGAKQFEYFKAKGLTVVRLPFKWERLQRALLGPLDETELQRLDQAVAQARASGIRLLFDLHNYARYNRKLVGTADVPNAALADFWKKLAAHYKDEAAVFAYGLMNEPHDTGGLWPAAAQEAVDAIRAVDMQHTLSVCGDGWSGAHSWKAINNALALQDPAQNLLYEAHQYFDRDNSGTYKQSYDDSGAHPTIGVERLQPFADWLKAHNVRGFIGEFGVPGDDPRWLEVLDNFIAAMKKHNIGGTYWAAGPWWGKYPLSVEPVKGEDRPQMEVLALYAGSKMKPRDAKTTYADASAQAKKPAAAGQTPAPPAAEKKSLPPGSHKVAYDCGVNKESYHYTNEGSEFSSDAVEDGGRKARKISYKHHGAIAWVGVGLYFGALDCNGYSAFSLGVRAEKPCKLEVKAYHADDARYTGSFQVGADWQELLIPFDKLNGAGGSFDSTRPLLKIELQPNPDKNGSSLFLGEFKLISTGGGI